MRKVVVTGGAGRLARFVIEGLVTQNVSVLAVDSVRPEKLRCRFVRADLADPGAVHDVLRGADAVLHLAAVPGPTIETAPVTFRNNVLTTFHIAEAAVNLGVQRVVFASSVFALGWNEDPLAYWPRYVPVDEYHPLTPFEAYGLSKAIGEEVLAAASRRSGMSVVSLRLMNIIHPEGYQGLPWPVPTAEHPTRFVMWPWIDVRDAATACRQALLASTSGFEAIYVAAAETRFDAPTRDLLQRFAPKVEIRQPLPGRTTVVSLEKARRLLGFEPAHHW